MLSEGKCPNPNRGRVSGWGWLGGGAPVDVKSVSLPSSYETMKAWCVRSRPSPPTTSAYPASLASGCTHWRMIASIVGPKPNSSRIAPWLFIVLGR